MTSTTRLPVFFVSHGGGPWPWIPEMTAENARLAESLRAIPRQVGSRPRAVLCISAHWETPRFTVQTNPRPSMLYDYGGFPDHTYRIEYPAPGAPWLAARVRELLGAAGIESDEDDRRGFDHGLFVPLYMAYPDADVPVVQLSIEADYDPASHLAAGRALAPLRDEGILILGSGFTFHNMRLFFAGAEGAGPSRAFDDWLSPTLVDHVGEERSRRLRAWASAPSARVCHPAEDHLVPLFVAVGAAEQEAGVRFYHERAFFGAVTSSSYRFGETGDGAGRPERP